MTLVIKAGIAKSVQYTLITVSYTLASAWFEATYTYTLIFKNIRNTVYKLKLIRVLAIKLAEGWLFCNDTLNKKLKHNRCLKIKPDNTVTVVKLAAHHCDVEVFSIKA